MGSGDVRNQPLEHKDREHIEMQGKRTIRRVGKRIG